ncbi:MAG: hypothetical protein AAFN70_13700 [Planctomycetota bacterium]
MPRETIYERSDDDDRDDAPRDETGQSTPSPFSSSGETGDGDVNQSLRPRRLSEMIGQRDVAEHLKIAIDAAQRRGEPLGHILLDGPPCTGTLRRHG